MQRLFSQCPRQILHYRLMLTLRQFHPVNPYGFNGLVPGYLVAQEADLKGHRHDFRLWLLGPAGKCFYISWCAFRDLFLSKKAGELSLKGWRMSEVPRSGFFVSAAIRYLAF